MTSDTTLWGIKCVWLRYFDVFRKDLLYGFMTSLTSPILYLISFGYGLGAMIGTVEVHGHTLTYRQFIFSGIIAQTLLFQGFFEAAFGSFIRMYYQRIFQAMATTPITLSEVLWAELLWDASKGTFSASIILAIGVFTGDFSAWGAVLALGLAFIGTLVFAGMGLWVAAISKSIEQINYPQYLVVFPMFLFCGIFFPLERLPGPFIVIAWLFPLTPILSLLRTMVLGLPLEWQALPLTLAWMGGFIYISRRAMFQRLIR